MILSISFQFEIFLTAIFIGLFLGVCYDFLKILRGYFVHNNFWVSVEDIVYWVFMSVVIFLIVLYQNDGEIRAFFIISMFLGMIIYRLIISNRFIKLLNLGIDTVLKIFKATIKVLLLPIKAFLHIVFLPFKKVFFMIKKRIKFKINIDRLKKYLKKIDFL